MSADFLAWLGWPANALLIAGSILTGFKWWHAFLLGLAGNCRWLASALHAGRLDMAFLCVVFGLLGAWNWWLWRREPTVQRGPLT